MTEHTDDCVQVPAHLTDDALKATQAKGGGWGRAAGYLLELPAEQRAAAETEGTIHSNTSPGWRYADSISHVVRRFKRGDLSTPLTEWNAKTCDISDSIKAQAAEQLATFKAPPWYDMRTAAEIADES